MAEDGEGTYGQACHPLGQLALSPGALGLHISKMGKLASHRMAVNITYDINGRWL